MRTGITLLGDFALEREERGWRLHLKSLNGAQVNVLIADNQDADLAALVGVYLDTFTRNAAASKSWSTEGMEGL